MKFDVRSVGFRRAALVVPLVAVALAGSAACETRGDAGGRPRPATSKPADPKAAEKQAAAAAYRSSWDEQVKAYGNASSKGTSLQRYTSLGALRRIEGELLSLDEAGQVMRGRPQLSPKVTSLDTSRKVPEARVTDCVDVAGWRLTKRKSGERVPLPKQRLTRYVSVAQLEKWGSQWKVTELSPQQREC